MDKSNSVLSNLFQAKTLKDAYEKATLALECSITQLDIEIIQPESKGFLGFFTKDAIIKATIKINKKKIKQKKQQTSQNKDISQVKEVQSKQVQKQKIFGDFYSSNDIDTIHNSIIIKKDDEIIIDDIKQKINELFATTCYKLDEIDVCFYNDETIYITFKGEDAALLIGKEGYRYKALSYILFNWIHEKYNLMLRLEVAEFLAAQEEAIYNYLIPVIQTIKDNGFYKTKPLDGVLVHIALKKLRDEFPNKYVAVKTNVKGDKYILVNEYRK